MFHIVLFEPEIPQNTGNIGRLCVGTDATLHLIKPIRFLLNDKSLKRAGLDYWQDLKLEVHNSIEEIYAAFPAERIFLASTKVTTCYWNVNYEKDDVFVFGPESRGLPIELLNKFPEQGIRIPMSSKIRSINLANSVAIIIYEALRQIS
ncbi:MAG: tRNA (cytidine(34)-2'-O)-methyltransferase [Candidatus Cloacimonas sp.]|jgi:tRNA (cytidine/uridine-2'-O-)-methyltransferase|nr:tRNA (cytidine(34)-2'-O)-methyltransferase [Candidatus Cloacimonas sp.]HPS61104.1 tRNA (cytidine(34)-2'-O)-methyltransferase [Candidatus Cloacimonas sp.]